MLETRVVVEAGTNAELSDAQRRAKRSRAQAQLGQLAPAASCANALRRASDAGECSNIDVPPGDPQRAAGASAGASGGAVATPFRRAPPLPSVSRSLRTREYVNSASSFLGPNHVDARAARGPPRAHAARGGGGPICARAPTSSSPGRRRV